MDSEQHKKSLILARQLALLRERFRAGLPQRLMAMRDSARAALEPERFDPVRLGDLRRQAHSLAGAAGTFGHAALSEAAHRLELAVIPYLGSPVPPAAEVVAGLQALLDAVAHIACAPEAGQAAGCTTPPAAHNGLPRVLVVAEDAAQAQAIAEHLDLHGYATEVHVGPRQIEAAYAPDGKPPVAIILDGILPEDPATGMQRLAELCQGGLGRLPVLYLSVRDDMAARLAAQRFGATRYLLKPVDPDVLVQALEDATVRDGGRPYRVLMVDDEAQALDYHAALLEAAGMQVETLDDPMRVYAAALRFRPDCLVLDLDMPGCSGSELAAVLRADARLQDTPILYLSVGSEERQGYVPDMVDDAVLHKPVEAGHLIGAVGARARRSREIRRLSEDLRAALREIRFQRQALDQHAIVSITDAAGTIAYANERFCRLSGYRRSELLGQNHRIVKSGLHPPAFYAALWQTISRGEVWHGEICNRRKDGSLYWVDSTIVPLLDESGTPTRYMSVRTDITALKEMQRALESARQQAEEAASVRIVELSHDLLTPMNAIMGFAQVLEADPEVGPLQKDSVREILVAGDRLLGVIKGILGRIPGEAEQPTHHHEAGDCSWG